MHPVLRFSATSIVFILRALRLALAIIAAVSLYQLAIDEIIDDDRLIAGLFLIWILTAYFVLPRLHRFLTKLYLPDYFIGRVRTGDGLLGDPVNIAVLGNKRELVRAMKAAGWSEADNLNFKTSIKMVRTSILKKSYKKAPVSSLFLFMRQQDLAFQQEVAGNPRKRHHVRFWRCPAGWKLPGGISADWLGAATYDENVGLSLFTLQVTHKIAENTDEERDFVVASLKNKGNARVKILHDYSSGYHHRNGGGDKIRTDGAMPIVRLAK